MFVSVVFSYLFGWVTPLTKVQFLAIVIFTTLFPILFVYDPNYMTTWISFIPSQFIFISCCLVLVRNYIYFTIYFRLVHCLLLINNNNLFCIHTILLLLSLSVKFLSLIWHRLLFISLFTKFNEVFMILGQSKIMSQWMFVVEWEDRKLHQFICIFTFWYYSVRTNESVRPSS